MAKRILLLSPSRCSTPDPVFPIGLAYLSAALRTCGHETRWLDFQAPDQPLPEVLAAYRPDFVGVSIRNIDDVLIRKRETYFGDLGALCEMVRQVHPCPVILGGSGFSIFPERLLQLTGADYGVQGEGEACLPALIAGLAHGRAMAHLPGLVYRRGAEVVANAPSASPPVEGVDGEDRPARLVSHYLKASGMLNVQTQRGCAHDCCYCTYPVVEGRRHRSRPAEAVAEELAQLRAQGVGYVFVVDAVFNSSPSHVTEICEAIIRRNLRIRWGCFLRPQGLTRALLELMARAGLAHIEFGSDSLCDAVLEAYDKHLTFDDIRQSSELARAAGIEQCHFLICGGPGETPETLEAGFQNSQRLAGGIIMAVVGMRIYPGTGLAQRAIREGCIATDSDLLTPVYYLAPGLTIDGVFERLNTFAARAPNWVVGDPTPAYNDLVERLRKRGVAGPLWSYVPLIQRLGTLYGGAAGPREDNRAVAG